jgi:hypothetical protein
MIRSIIVSYIRYHRLHHHIDIDTWKHLWGRVMHLPWVWTGCIVAQYSFLSNYPNTVIKELVILLFTIYKHDIHSHKQGIKRFIGWYFILQRLILSHGFRSQYLLCHTKPWPIKIEAPCPLHNVLMESDIMCVKCSWFYRTGATGQTLPGTSYFGKILWRRFLVFLFLTSKP